MLCTEYLQYHPEHDHLAPHSLDLHDYRHPLIRLYSGLL